MLTNPALFVPDQEMRMQSLQETTPAAAVLAPVTPLPIIPMARFRRLMLYEGWTVDLARMCVDSAYAYDCLALAHTSNDAALRRAALDLFAAYDRNLGPGRCH
jgi:hypothetical protein